MISLPLFSADLLLFVSSILLPCWMSRGGGSNGGNGGNGIGTGIVAPIAAGNNSSSNINNISYSNNNTVVNITGGGNNNNNVVDNDDNFLDLYRQLGVRRPTHTMFGLNRLSWKIHGKILPLLHGTQTSSSSSPPSSSSSSISAEGGPPQDVFVNLRVLWCKVISSFDPTSPAYEYYNKTSHENEETIHRSNNSIYTTYNMLYEPRRTTTTSTAIAAPTTTRLGSFVLSWMIRYFWWCFPRWMHANIELRTAFLERTIRNHVDQIRRRATTEKKKKKKTTTKICLVVLGGGYDPRAVRWLDLKLVDQVYELDLPQVIQSKQQMLLQCCHRCYGGRQPNVGMTTIAGITDNQMMTNANTNMPRGIILRPPPEHFDTTTTGSSMMDLKNHQQQQQQHNDDGYIVRKLHDNFSLIGLDLNDDVAFDNVWTFIQSQLLLLSYGGGDNNNNAGDDVGGGGGTGHNTNWHVIFLSEAVLLYLNPGRTQHIYQSIVGKNPPQQQKHHPTGSRVSPLSSSSSSLSLSSSSLSSSSSLQSTSFLFVDRLKDATTTVNLIMPIGGGNNNTTTRDSRAAIKSGYNLTRSMIASWLAANGGWMLDQFMIKRGATQHMGLATCAWSQNSG